MKHLSKSSEEDVLTFVNLWFVKHFQLLRYNRDFILLCFILEVVKSSCAEGLTPGSVIRDYSGNAGKEPKSAIFKASIISAVLSLWPNNKVFSKFIIVLAWMTIFQFLIKIQGWSPMFFANIFSLIILYSRK